MGNEQPTQAQQSNSLRVEVIESSPSNNCNRLAQAAPAENAKSRQQSDLDIEEVHDTNENEAPSEVDRKRSRKCRASQMKL